MIILFSLIFPVNTAAQERDNVGHRVGPWSMANHPCFSKLSWKLRKSFYSDDSESYTNEIEIKNNYGRAVTFSYNFTENANDSSNRYRKTLGPNETYTSTYCPNVRFVNFYVAEVCFNGDCKDGCFAQCDSGTPNQPPCNSNTGQGTATTQQNNPATNSNSPQASQNAQTQRQNQEIANKNAEAQRQQKLAQQQQEQQRKQEAVSQLATATTDLVTMASRKRANKSTLSNDDGQMLLRIVNSESPQDYVQNIIDIFSDLGYTHRKTVNDKGSITITITLNNDVNNINDFLLIFIHPASYDSYNRISFSYHRKEKLLSQLTVLKNDLTGYKFPELKGISPSKQKLLAEKNNAETAKEEKKKATAVKIAEMTPVKSNRAVDGNVTV